jgi:hypothetical protein
MRTAIAGLFKAIVQTILEQRLQKVFQIVLEQPVNRKGRYLVLDILLPYMQSTVVGENLQGE